MGSVDVCRRCGEPKHPTRMFCPGCGLIQDRAAKVYVSTDVSRGRALDEIYKKVEAGRAETQRDVESRFERDVYEHVRQVI